MPASPQNAPYQAFNVKDGAFVVGTGNDALWIRFCEIFEMKHLSENDAYRDNASRVRNQKKLAEEIQELLKDRRVADCIEKLDKAGIPGGPINSIGEVMKDPHVIDRDMILTIQHPRAGEIKNI